MADREFPDVGDELCSGANDFHYPQTEIPQEPGKGDATEDTVDAFFSGSANRRNQGRQG